MNLRISYCKAPICQQRDDHGCVAGETSNGATTCSKNTLVRVCELGTESPREAWINEAASAMRVLKISMIHSVAFETTATISNTDHKKTRHNHLHALHKLKSSIVGKAVPCWPRTWVTSMRFNLECKMQGASKTRRELITRKYAWMMWKAANTCLKGEIHR